MKLKGINIGWLAALGEVVIFIALAIICYVIHKAKESSDSSPVEETLKIDSISKENSKLIIEVNNLDSVKNAKVIEIKSLDNDSTLKLFYQLIRQ